MKWKLEKFDKTLVIVALLTVVVLGMSAISVRARDNNLLGNTWQFSSPQARILAGAGGIEFGQSAWLNGNDLVIEVINPLADQAKIHMQLKAGASPCGDMPAISLLPDSRKYAASGEGSGRYVVEVPAKRVRQISFKVSGKKCAIESDPRLFIGSIAVPTVSDWTNK